MRATGYRWRVAIPRIAIMILASRAGGAMAAEKPNIILILADDLGYGDLSCYGHLRFKTPNLDRMAAEGTKFTQFNTPCPFCAPTRASLLTGRYPSRCGLVSNPTPDVGPVQDRVHLPTSEILLPSVLKDAGYATAMVGKWHLGHQNKDWWPTRRGFDEYLGILYSNDMRPVRLIDGEKVVEYPVAQATITRRYTDRALAFIERSKGPFFLYLAHAMPHRPLACSEKHYKKSGAGLYGDVMAELDENIGRVLEKAKAINPTRPTIVIFTSDNGAYYGGSSGPLRGMKGTTWEGGYRVPCVVWWPGVAPTGAVRNDLCVMMDLFATIVAAAGAASPVDRRIDGVDLRPVLEGKAAPERSIAGLGRGQLSVIRDQRWKLHLASQAPPSPPGPGSPGDRRAPDGVTLLAPYDQPGRGLDQYPGLLTGDETTANSLFDLANDPGEQRNVAANHPDVVARLTREFEKLKGEMTRESR